MENIAAASHAPIHPVPVHQINNGYANGGHSQPFNRAGNVPGANRPSNPRDFGSPLRTPGSPQSYSAPPQHSAVTATIPQHSAPVANYHSQPVPARTDTAPVSGSSPQTIAAHPQPTGTPRNVTHYYESHPNYYHSSAATSVTANPAQCASLRADAFATTVATAASRNRAAIRTEIKTGRAIDIHQTLSKKPRGKFPRGVFAFATPPPLAKSLRGNFPAAIRADEGTSRRQAVARSISCPSRATRHASPIKSFSALTRRCAAPATASFGWKNPIRLRSRTARFPARKTGNARAASPKFHRRSATFCANISRRFAWSKDFSSRKI